MDVVNVFCVECVVGEIDLVIWFDGLGWIIFDEEIIGFGKYGYILIVLISEGLFEVFFDEEDEDVELE